MIFPMGRQQSGASLLSWQRVLETRTYKAVWIVGHKTRQAHASGMSGSGGRGPYGWLAGLSGLEF